MIIVGRTVIKDERSGRERKVGYTDIPKDIMGWVDAKKYMPGEYDIVHAKMQNGKVRVCWRTTTTVFIGRKVKEEDGRVIYWKRTKELLDDTV